MIKIGIVGTQELKWTQINKDKAKAEILGLLLDFKSRFETVLVSGHCQKGGVDIWAEEIADKLGIKKEIYPAVVEQWNDEIREEGSIFDEQMFIVKRIGYKSRNIKIAETCDILYCIVPQTYVDTGPSAESDHCKHCQIFGHPSNGGCWTMKYAKKLGKETHLVVIQ